MDRRKLVIEYMVLPGWEWVVWWVKEQTHRGGEFNSSGISSFRHRGAIITTANRRPMSDGSVMWVRGSDTDQDGNPVVSRYDAAFLGCLAAVREYNRTNGGAGECEQTKPCEVVRVE